MHARIPLVVSLALALLLAGCGSGNGERSERDPLTEAMSESGVMSEEEAEGITQAMGGDAAPAELPTGWIKGREGLWFGPRDSTGFTTNVNVIQASVLEGDDVSLDDLVVQAESGNEAFSKGTYERIRRSDATLMGQPAVRLEYSATFDEADVHGVQYILIDGRDIFTITGSASEQGWPKHRAELERVIASFERGRG